MAKFDISSQNYTKYSLNLISYAWNHSAFQYITQFWLKSSQKTIKKLILTRLKTYSGSPDIKNSKSVIFDVKTWTTHA